MNTRYALIVLAILCAIAMTALAQPAPPPTAGAAPQVIRRAGPPVVMIVSREADAMQNLANGCWVRMYDGKDYQGEWVTLVGPVDLPSLSRSGASHIEGFDSLQVGPGARLSAYRDARFESTSSVFEANARVPDLARTAPPEAGRIDTVRVACTA